MDPSAPAADLPRRGRRLPRLARLQPCWPALLGGAWLLLLFAPLLAPGRVLANRDILVFHLPLAACFRNLVAGGGLPVWNPWLNGGQPILSNPSYAAFYPLTWLGLPLPPVYALSLSILLHAAIAFAGAWRLARQVGACRGGAAALAAVGYTGSGALLSLLSAWNLFRGMVWIPWVLALGDAALRRRAAGGWLKPALLCGLALALQLLNGEPSMATLSAIGLLAFAAAALPHRRAAAWRVLVPLLTAALLAAVQLVPTAGRLAGTARGPGLTPREATLWSSPPQRLIELALPHFFGDPMRSTEHLFFGHGLHDMDFPYVLSIYPGLLVTVLAAAALCLWPIPRRAAWVLCFAAGAFLALGRHNPLYGPLRRLLPPLAVQRFPERFVVLAVAALVFAAALAWQRLLDERRAGRPQAAELPLALSLVALAVAALLAGLLQWVPATAVGFLREHSALPPSAAALGRGIAFLRGEAGAALATAAATAALLALCRWRRPRPALLSTLAVALLAGDLWHYGHSLVRTMPTAEYREPPRLLRQLASPGARIFVERLPDERQLPLAKGDPDLALARAELARLTPYTAALWKVPYALNDDFDRMLTRPGSVMLDVLYADLSQKPDVAFRLLGAWGVGGTLVRASTAAGQPEAVPPPASAAPVDVPRRATRNPYRLPLYRFVPRVSFHPSYASALYLARGQGYAVERHEHCVRAAAPPATVYYPSPPQVLALQPDAARIDLRYRAAAGGFFVAANTFDEGWRAAVDGKRCAIYRTALGQQGVELPPGEHRLVLAYSDPLVPLGAAITLLALAACTVLLARRGAAGAPGSDPAIDAAIAAAAPGPYG
jgi:hypothetical protein